MSSPAMAASEAVTPSQPAALNVRQPSHRPSGSISSGIRTEKRRRRAPMRGPSSAFSQYRS